MEDKDKINNHNDSAKVITRRDFFNKIGTTATGVVLLGSLGVTLDFQEVLRL